MRRVPLLAILAALLAFLAVPSGAATSSGILLRGSKTSYVDLYVYVNKTVTVADIRFKTKGSYVGFFLAPAPADRETVGGLVMPRVGATGADATRVMQLGESWDVQAGKYRMFLLTDGPSEVFVPIEGQGFRAYTPRRAARLSVRPMDFIVPAGSAGEAQRDRVTVSQRSLMVVAGRVTSKSLTAVEQMSACVAQTTCSTPSTDDARLPLDDAWASGAQLVTKPGDYAASLAVTRLAGADAGSRVTGAILVLTIGRQS